MLADTNRIGSKIRKLGWLVACWALLYVPCAVGQQGELTPTYWKQRLFYIPYQVKQTGKLLNPIAKVQLLTSRTGADDWATLQEAEPNVQGFSYHAPEDGEYWFALRHLDRRGQPWPTAEVRPQMRLIVDTVKPELTLEGTTDATGEIVVRYEAHDTNLRPDTLVLEVRGRGDAWTPLRLGPPDVAQPGRLVGRVRWRPPSGMESIDLRAAIADFAGQRAQHETKIALREEHPSLIGPALGNPFVGAGASSIQAAPIRTAPLASANSSSNSNSVPSLPQLPSQDWPSTNRLPASQLPLTQSKPSSPQSPPQLNPYTIADRSSDRTRARLVADGTAGASGWNKETTGRMQSLSVTPLDSDNAPPLFETTPWPTPQTRQAAKQSNLSDIWSTTPQTSESGTKNPGHDNHAASRVVNSRTFDIEYDLQSVGPWGVSKVEIWGTPDNGQSWKSFGVDSDNRSPVRVTVPTAGTFGFRILVDGANSAGSLPPQAGVQPELTVAVDLQPPSAKLLAAELGQGNLADHLLVRWEASDTNLEPRPIALFYSSYPNGPWSTIASGLENTGSYTWRIERHVPGRFYLRLEARDVAGNQATYQSSSPVELARPQPTGRLRGVRPITGSARP